MSCGGVRETSKNCSQGVPARGDVSQQFRRALEDESLKGEYEQCESRQAKDLFRKECKNVSESVGADQSFRRDRLLELDVSITGSDCSSRRATAEAAAHLSRKCGALSHPFFRWDKFSMQFKFLLFEEGSVETLTKAWAAKQELGEESEPKAPEPVRGEKRKAVKTIECPHVSPAKPKKPKFSDALDVTDTPFQGALGEGNEQGRGALQTHITDEREKGIVGTVSCFNNRTAMKRPNVESNHFLSAKSTHAWFSGHPISGIAWRQRQV